MSSTTLISLAMLKVNLDHGVDYLDYLQPFILQILDEKRPDPVTDETIKEYIRNEFGLEIPSRAIQLVLKRISKKQPLEKNGGVYRITGKVANPGITIQKSSADRHIKSVILGLIEYSQNTSKPIDNEEDAVTALLAFLSQFNIPCLKAYLRGTTIPDLSGKHETQVVLVSKYVMYLQENSPERFDSFIVLVQGHMLANALLCPDLQNAPKTYKGVTFFLDTPVLIRWLGLEGEHKQKAVQEVIDLVRRLGGSFQLFSHTHDELERVVKNAADYIDAANGRGAIVFEARHTGRTKSDLLLLAGQIDDKLIEEGFTVKDTPEYMNKFQIDEAEFGKLLQDEVSYFNPRAKEFDINSVRSIYVLRAGTSPNSIEKSRAVLVTNNSGFARAAFEYGQKHEESREVSVVITDFSLANMAWLKAPMGAPSLPTTEILSFSYAALQPSRELLNKYLVEIEKLEKQGKITERDHQLLRSSTKAHDELMALTLGEEEALTEETISETLRRVTLAIKSEENEKLHSEKVSHQQTIQSLIAEKKEKKSIQERLYWRCVKRAKNISWGAAIVLAILLLAGIAAGLGLKSSYPSLGWLLIICSGIVTLASTIDVLFSFSVREARNKFEKWLLVILVRRDSLATGLDLKDFL